MKQIQLIILMMVYSWGYSQTLSPEVVASSGEYVTGSTVQLSWTIGEILSETYSNSSSQLTQGFHQSTLMVTSLEDLAESLHIKVFPNPTTDLIQIELQETSERFTLRLFDVQGREILSKGLSSLPSSSTIDLSAYHAGSYFLHLSDHKATSIKIVKILKIN